MIRDLRSRLPRYSESDSFTRLVSAWIDWFTLFCLLLGGLALAELSLGSERYQTIAMKLAAVWSVVLALSYFVVPEAVRGQTLGKWMTGFQVVDGNGQPPGYLRAFARMVLRALEANPLLPFGLLPGVIAALGTKRNQRIGDLVAGTYVVRVKVLARLRLEQEDLLR